MELIDSHCHLDFPDFDEDRRDLLLQCKEQGITQFIVPGVSCDTWSRLKSISRKYPEIKPAYGLHPYFIKEHKSNHIEALERFINETKPIAVGEIGLDYYLKDLDKSIQQTFFHSQLDLARQYDLPVILHVRKSHDQVLKALRTQQVRGGVVHAFNGSLQQAMQYLALGFKLGFGGAVTYPNASHLKSLVKELPLEHIVLETDSPDMKPADYFSSRNTPLTLIPVLQTIASIRKESSQVIATQTTLNVSKVFELS